MFTLQFTLDKRLDHLEELIHINLIFRGPGCELYMIYMKVLILSCSVIISPIPLHLMLGLISNTENLSPIRRKYLGCCSLRAKEGM